MTNVTAITLQNRCFIPIETSHILPLSFKALFKVSVLLDLINYKQRSLLNMKVGLETVKCNYINKCQPPPSSITKAFILLSRA